METKSRQRKPENPIYRKAFRQKRIEDGVCTRCGKEPPEPGYIDCTACKAILHERNNRWSAKKREWCRANGICTVCKKRPAQPAVRSEGVTATCAWCYDRNQEYKATHKKSAKQE